MSRAPRPLKNAAAETAEPTPVQAVSAHVAATAGTPFDLHGSVMMSLLGMVFAFLAGLVALRWLSSWLEEGRWYLFGIYCIVAACVVFGLHHAGY